MAKRSDYEVLAFERIPGVWRISITSSVEHGLGKVRTRQSVRVFTEVDFASESEARQQAHRIIRDLPVRKDS